MENCGIYKISSLSQPDKIYIGSSVLISKRKNSHFSKLKRNKHHSFELQNHFNEYGILDLKFEIIELCSQVELNTTEQRYIKELKPFFNKCKIVGTTRGITHIKRKALTEETKAKMRLAASSRIVSTIQRNDFKIISNEIANRKFMIVYLCNTCNRQYKTSTSVYNSKICNCKLPNVEKLKKIKPIKNTMSKEEVRCMAQKAKIDKILKQKNGMIGIVFESGRYRARVRVGKKNLDLGRYRIEIDAAQARNKYIIENKLSNTLCII